MKSGFHSGGLELRMALFYSVRPCSLEGEKLPDAYKSIAGNPLKIGATD